MTCFDAHRGPAAAAAVLAGLAAATVSLDAVAQIDAPLAVAGCAPVAAVLYDACRVARIYACDGADDRVIVQYEDGAPVEVEEREDGVLMTRWSEQATGRSERFWSLDGLRGRDLLSLAPGEQRTHRFGYRTDPSGDSGEADQIFEGAGEDVLDLPSGAVRVVALVDETFWAGGQRMRAERLVATKIGAVIGMVVYGDDGSGPVLDRTPRDLVEGDDPRFDALGLGSCGGVS